MSKKSMSTVEALGKAQAEIRRLAPFETWVRQQSKHAFFCRAVHTANADCTCGLKSLLDSKQAK